MTGSPTIFPPGTALSRGVEYRLIVRQDHILPGLRKAWHLCEKVDNHYILYVGLAEDDRVIVVYHEWGQKTATKEKFPSMRAAHRGIVDLLETKHIVARLW